MPKLGKVFAKNSVPDALVDHIQVMLRLVEWGPRELDGIKTSVFDRFFITSWNIGDKFGRIQAGNELDDNLILVQDLFNQSNITVIASSINSDPLVLLDLNLLLLLIIFINLNHFF